jgi:integrase
MCVTALRTLFGRAVDDELLTTNPAEKLHKGSRSETPRRALTLSEIEQLFQEVTTGGDDPELDFGLTWLLFESAGRRGGILGLTVGAILLETQLMRFHEKQNRERTQPISLDLIEYLLHMAKVRGGECCDPESDQFDPRSPLLYFRDSTPEAPHPLSRKRFETLFGRIQRRFPWAAETQFTAHALRHTTAMLIERTFSNQVARKYLGHGARTTTDSYTKASHVEVATAFTAITGFSHPDAR